MGLEAQPQREPRARGARDVQADRHAVTGHGVGLAAERQRVHGHLEVRVRALAGGQAQGSEVERVGQRAPSDPG